MLAINKPPTFSFVPGNAKDSGVDDYSPQYIVAFLCIHEVEPGGMVDSR